MRSSSVERWRGEERRGEERSREEREGEEKRREESMCLSYLVRIDVQRGSDVRIAKVSVRYVPKDAVPRNKSRMSRGNCFVGIRSKEFHLIIVETKMRIWEIRS